MKILLVDEPVPVVVDHVEGLLELLDLVLKDIQGLVRAQGPDPLHPQQFGFLDNPRGKIPIKTCFSPYV